MPCLNAQNEINCSKAKPSHEFCRGVATCSNGVKEAEYCMKYHDCIPYAYEKGPKNSKENRGLLECQERTQLSNQHFDYLNRMDEEQQVFQKTVFKNPRSSVTLIFLSFYCHQIL